VSQDAGAAVVDDADEHDAHEVGHVRDLRPLADLVTVQLAGEGERAIEIAGPVAGPSRAGAAYRWPNRGAA
jgi:hypothetical protein